MLFVAMLFYIVADYDFASYYVFIFVLYDGKNSTLLLVINTV